MRENVEIGIDLREFARLLLKRVWIVVLCAVLVGATVLVYTVNFVTPMYEASISMYVNNNSEKDKAYISSADLAVALRLVETYTNIIHSDTVLEKVIAEAGVNLTAEQLRGGISAEAIGETEMFQVTVKTSNPQVSADLANTIAAVAPGEIAAIIEGSSAKIIDYAKAPKEPSSPSYLSNTVIGVLLGTLLAVCGVFLEMLLDTRIKNEEDLMRIAQLPVLGTIPNLSGETGSSTGKKVRR